MDRSGRFEEDLELASRIAKRDAAAIDTFVNQNIQSLNRFFFSLGNDRDTAKDLAQESLVRAIQKAHAYRGEAPLKSWLFKVALREHQMAFRKIKRALSLQSLDHCKQLEGPSIGIDGIALSKAVDGLSNALKTTFVLHEVVGWSTVEVAEILDVPVGTVTSRLSLARTRLREVLSKTTEVEHYAKPITERS